MWTSIVLLKDHCCLESVGKHRAAEGSLLFGVHEARHSAAKESLLFGVCVSKHRAAEGSFLFAASVASSHE
jgi:hypothetical protein